VKTARSLKTYSSIPFWRLRFCHTFAEAQAGLHTSYVAVVISEGRLCDGHDWRDILHHLQGMPIQHR